MEWDEATTLNFINLYRKKEVLWNTKHPKHFKMLAKNNAWEQLAYEIGTTEEECRKKMCNLLSSLRREKAKVKKAREQQMVHTGKNESRWFAFKSLMFLWNKNNSKETLNNIADNVNETVIKDEVETEEEIASRNVCPPSPPHQTQKKRKTTEKKKLDKAFKLLTASTVVKSRDEDDECHSFGIYIIKKMRQYSTCTKNAVQHAISNIIFSADGGYFEQPHPSEQRTYPSDSYSHPLEICAVSYPHFTTHTQSIIPYQHADSCYPQNSVSLHDHPTARKYKSSPTPTAASASVSAPSPPTSSITSSEDLKEEAQFN